MLDFSYIFCSFPRGAVYLAPYPAYGGPMVPPRETREIPLATQENAGEQNHCGGARGPINQNNEDATEDEICAPLNIWI